MTSVIYISTSDDWWSGDYLKESFTLSLSNNILRFKKEENKVYVLISFQLLNRL